MTTVDNSRIEGFFRELQVIVARWNEEHSDIGSWRLELEGRLRGSGQRVVRLYPEPKGVGGSATITALEVWFDADSGKFYQKTPRLPVDTTRETSIGTLQHVFETLSL